MPALATIDPSKSLAELTGIDWGVAPVEEANNRGVRYIANRGAPYLVALTHQCPRISTVPYSTNALSKMKRELEAREERERKREPNRITGANSRPVSPLEAGR